MAEVAPGAASLGCAQCRTKRKATAKSGCAGSRAALEAATDGCLRPRRSLRSLRPSRFLRPSREASSHPHLLALCNDGGLPLRRSQCEPASPISRCPRKLPLDRRAYSLHSNSPDIVVQQSTVENPPGLLGTEARGGLVPRQT